MASDIQIRVVNVEFLRPGPPHNQLLSPLTEYIAVCNNSDAGVVTLPYEQARFERKLNELRYGGLGGEDLSTVLHEVGEGVAKVLGSVPGLPGALTIDTGRSGPGMLIHLRLTISASELAMLPFELSKVPLNATQSSEAWLGIQSRPPVVVTRNVRSLSPESVAWPARPRVLFISSSREDVPFDQHWAALLRAVEPFVHVRFDRCEGKKTPDQPWGKWEPGDPCLRLGKLLTILHDPTLNDIRLECRADPDAHYTHVHVLAHGVRDGQEYGLLLRGDGDTTDVVSGARLAGALTCVDGRRGVHRPAVATLASCDSAGVGSVVVPSTHIAHALHQAGIPLVVASQFPLSKAGSQPLAESLYAGLLRAEHPLVLLHELRSELHARYTSTAHDWASVVVYESLPRAMGDQLDELCYHQGRRAVDAALEKVDIAVDSNRGLEDGGIALTAAVDAAVKRLPFEGPFAIECLGLRASAAKRLAQAAHSHLKRCDYATDKWLAFDPYERLEAARMDYDQAVRRLLVNDAGAVPRAASVHWVLVQAISLATVLGTHPTARAEGAWEAAKLAADFYTDHQDITQRAWAHASLAELWLLRLAETRLDRDAKEQAGRNAVEHARKLANMYPSRSDFPVASTRRQVRRYIDWWGDPPFVESLKGRASAARAPWDGNPGLLETAREMERVLREAGTRARRWTPGATPFDPEASPAAARKAGDAEPAAQAAAVGGTAKAGERLGRKRKSADSFLRLEMLPAGHGDCLWIEYGRAGKTHRVLVDCGTQGTAKRLLARVEKVPRDERFLELFVMTHVDADHIGGALPFFKAIKNGLRIGDVWFNGWDQIASSDMLGARQAEMFTTALKDFRQPINQWRQGRAILTGSDRLPRHELPGGLTLTLLSPTATQLRKMAPVWTRELKKHGLIPGTRVDYEQFLSKKPPSQSTDVDQLADTPFESDDAPANGTSISLLAEYEGVALLLGADAHVPVLIEAIGRLLAERGTARLKLSAFKLPHHGSQNNLSRQLLELVDCPMYLFSSNGAHFFHPDREAVARVIKYGTLNGRKPSLHFNYKTKFNQVWESAALREKHRYSAHYPSAEEDGLTIDLLGNGR